MLAIYFKKIGGQCIKTVDFSNDKNYNKIQYRNAKQNDKKRLLHNC